MGRALHLTGEETSFAQTEKESTNDKTSKALGEAHADRHDTFALGLDKVIGNGGHIYVPHKIIIELSHVDGEIFRIMMLAGTSQRIYGMKNMKSAML